MTPSPKLHGWLHAITGSLLALSGYLLGRVPAFAVHWSAWQKPLLAAGAIVALLGALPRGPIGRVSRPLCVPIATLLLCLAAAEGAFRLIGFDFRHQEEAYHALPPFYRKPMVPTGAAFFRRPGPQTWTGPPIRRCLERAGMDASAYADEPVLTLHYDALGFRNVPPLSDWELAIAGDSFTELGHLPHEQLFTTLLAARLQHRVLNLGVSHTGPLAQLSYLQDYGLAPSTRAALIVFFEGNDLDDLAREDEALRRVQTTGRPNLRRLIRQTSLLRALGEFLRRPPQAWEPQPVPVDAWFQAAEGELPVTFGFPPKRWADAAPATQAALRRCVADYARWGRAHQLRLWLAYMPSKVRVLQDRLRFTDAARAEGHDRVPTDLPQVVAELAQEHGIGFVDLTPDLQRVSRERQALLYNGLFDTHLDAAGSAVVADTLARALEANP